MSIDLISAFITYAFVSSITPGPNNLMLMTSGTNFGFKLTIPHLLGVVIGFIVMIIMAGLGLVALFDAFPVSYLVIKVFSVGYLIFLAWKIATSAAPQHNQVSATEVGKPFTFFQAALFQWVNPKAIAMALTAISVYTPQSHSWVHVLLIALMFGAVNLPSVSTWILLGTQMRRYLNQPRRLKIFNISAAVLLIGSLYPIVFSIKT